MRLGAANVGAESILRCIDTSALDNCVQLPPPGYSSFSPECMQFILDGIECNVKITSSNCGLGIFRYESSFKFAYKTLFAPWSKDFLLGLDTPVCTETVVHQ